MGALFAAAVAAVGCGGVDLLLAIAAAAGVGGGVPVPGAFVYVSVAVAEAVEVVHETLRLAPDMHDGYATKWFERIYADTFLSETHSNRFDLGRSLVSSC